MDVQPSAWDWIALFKVSNQISALSCITSWLQNIVKLQNSVEKFTRIGASWKLEVFKWSVGVVDYETVMSNEKHKLKRSTKVQKWL